MATGFRSGKLPNQTTLKTWIGLGGATFMLSRTRLPEDAGSFNQSNGGESDDSSPSDSDEPHVKDEPSNAGDYVADADDYVADGGGNVADSGGNVADGGGNVADGGGNVADGGGNVADGGGTGGDTGADASSVETAQVGTVTRSKTLPSSCPFGLEGFTFNK